MIYGQIHYKIDTIVKSILTISLHTMIIYALTINLFLVVFFKPSLLARSLTRTKFSY